VAIVKLKGIIAVRTLSGKAARLDRAVCVSVQLFGVTAYHIHTFLHHTPNRRWFREEAEYDFRVDAPDCRRAWEISLDEAIELLVEYSYSSIRELKVLESLPDASRSSTPEHGGCDREMPHMSIERENRASKAESGRNINRPCFEGCQDCSPGATIGKGGRGALQLVLQRGDSVPTGGLSSDRLLKRISHHIFAGGRQYSPPKAGVQMPCLDPLPLVDGRVSWRGPRNHPDRGHAMHLAGSPAAVLRAALAQPAER
jgi:hypothetical protein